MFSDLTFFLVIIAFILFIFYATPTNLFTMLALSELFWITLYSLALLIALMLGNTQVLALSLFFLMFSAVEISTGFSLITVSKDKQGLSSFDLSTRSAHLHNLAELGSTRVI